MNMRSTKSTVTILGPSTLWTAKSQMSLLSLQFANALPDRNSGLARARLPPFRQESHRETVRALH